VQPAAPAVAPSQTPIPVASTVPIPTSTQAQLQASTNSTAVVTQALMKIKQNTSFDEFVKAVDSLVKYAGNVVRYAVLYLAI
jgi:hypothetical protein